MMNQEYKYLVGVKCMTFNQSKYILDALNGFVMQQTNFPFVVMVIDDASTDGEQEVIRAYVNEHFDVKDTKVAYEKETDYAHIMYAQHKTNKNCYFAVLYLKENHYSQRKAKLPYLSEWRDYVKYEALCEGDDYWIHPEKLQMQVDFLEENEEYSMCFHGAEIQVEDGINIKKDGRINLYKNLEEREYTGAEILREWTIPTASVVYRRGINIVKDSRFIHGDIIIFLSATEFGKIFCIKQKSMSVYRLVTTGAVAKGDHWMKFINHHKAIEEVFKDKDVKNAARERILYFYIISFFTGRLGKQSFNVLKRVIIDYEYIIPFILKTPVMLIQHIIANKNK